MSNDTVRANAQSTPFDRLAPNPYRRAALGALASLPALSACALASPALSAPDDAEIIALSAKVLALAAQADEITATRVDPVDDEWHDLVKVDWKAACAFGDARAARDSGYSEARGRLNGIDWKIRMAATKAFKFKPRTSKGVVAQSVALLAASSVNDGRAGGDFAKALASNAIDVELGLVAKEEV